MPPDTATALKQAFVATVAARLSEPPPAALIGFDVTRYTELAAAAPTRVVDLPIAEESIMGLAVGLARAGTDVFVDLMFETFLFRAFDVLSNQLALGRIRPHPSGAIVVRALSGVMSGAGTQHATVAYPALLQLPHVRVAAPAAPDDVRTALGSVRGGEILVLIMAAEAWQLGPLRPLSPGVSACGQGRSLGVVCPAFLLARVQRALALADLLADATIAIPTRLDRAAVRAAIGALDIDGPTGIVTHVQPLALIDDASRATWLSPATVGQADDGAELLARELRQMVAEARGA